MTTDKPIYILYMEDDRGEARLLQKRLNRLGYEVDLAFSGEEGLDMYDSNRHNLIAVDHTIPNPNGLEVIRILASQGSLPPTIMITGTGDEQTAVKAMRLGAYDYIVKDPAGGYLELLPEVIEQSLKQHRLLEEKKQAEEDLRVSEARYRLIAENSFDLIGLLDLEGKILYASPSHFRVLGYQPDELRHTNIFDALHPEDRATALAVVGELLKSETNTVAEVRMQGKDQTWAVVEAVLSIVIDELDDEKRILLSARDITERKRIEQERENLVLELQEALAQIKTLSGLIPICAACKNIRDDQGYWHRVESYIQNHSDAEFSHGICPNCKKKLYAGVFEQENKE